MRCWIGVDLDGTLAFYDDWKGPEHIGDPIPLMLERVKRWLASRVAPLYTNPGSVGTPQHVRYCEAVQAEQAIRQWCKSHFGRELPVTALKDWAMAVLWDDRCVAVEANTGQRVDAV